MDQFKFEVFDRRSVPLVKRPEVTIQASGSLSMNASAHHALGKPEAVEMLYDREQRVIGIRAVSPEAPNAYPLRAVGKGGSFIVSGRGFVAYFGIPVGGPVRREVRMVDDVLIIDLKDPGRDATSNRSRKKNSENASDNGSKPVDATSTGEVTTTPA